MFKKKIKIHTWLHNLTAFYTFKNNQDPKDKDQNQPYRDMDTPQLM